MIGVPSSSVGAEQASVGYEGPLRFGDVVSLHSPQGFLATLGNVDARVVVKPMEGNTNRPPNKFRDCLFEVCPTNRYMAWEQLQIHKDKMTGKGKNKNDGFSLMDQKVLEQLKEAAESERHVNEKEAAVTLGKAVVYNQVVQLRHLKSNKFLTTHRRLAAAMERNALRVSLDLVGNEGSVFEVIPHYKHRVPNEVIMSGDKVIFRSTFGTHSLHPSTAALVDHPDCLEVNASSQVFANWQIRTYQEHQADLRLRLKSGDVIRMYHGDESKFLSASPSATAPDVPDVYLRVSGKVDKTTATSSNALWEVDLVSDNPTYGGVGKWCSRYRFKHLSSDK